MLKYLLQKDRKIREYFLKEINKEDHVDKVIINSQVKVDKGRLDILLTDNKELYFIIENKVGASFRNKQIIDYKSAFPKAVVLTLTKPSAEFDDNIGNPDRKMYWPVFAKFLEDNINCFSAEIREIVNEFLKFLKEEKMAINKVGWAMVDGLREKENLLNMVELILESFKAKGELVKKTRKSVGGYWDVFNYKVAKSMAETDIIFIHRDVTLYFRLLDKTGKYKGFESYPFDKRFKIVDKFDFRKEHFFPLDASEQEGILSKFIADAIKKIKNL
jgi:hypothetical protein